MSSKDYRFEEDDHGMPILFAATKESPPAEIGGVAVDDSEGIAESFTESAHRFLERQIQARGANGVRVFRSGNEANIVLERDGATDSAFVVPTTASDPVVVDEFEAALRPPRSGIPEGVSAAEWEHRIDAVRDAARELDSMEDGDIREFLGGRVRDVNVVDIEGFKRDVREQRLDDLTDVLDSQLRSKVEGMRRARRHVRLTAPKGWTARTFNSLSQEEHLKLLRRLVRRGWSKDDLSKYIVSKVHNDDLREKVDSEFATMQIALGDWVQGQSFSLSEATDMDVLEGVLDLARQPVPTHIELSEMMERVMKAMSAPVVNVHIERPSAKKIVKRDDDGFITEVVDGE